MNAQNYLNQVLERGVLSKEAREILQTILMEVTGTADIDPEQQKWVINVLIKEALENGSQTPSSIADYINKAVAI